MLEVAAIAEGAVVDRGRHVRDEAEFWPVSMRASESESKSVSVSDERQSGLPPALRPSGDPQQTRVGKWGQLSGMVGSS